MCALGTTPPAKQQPHDVNIITWVKMFYNCQSNTAIPASTSALYLMTVCQYSSGTCCWIFSLETLPPGDPNEGVVYLRIVLSPEEAPCMCISVFGKRLSRKNNNVVVFLFTFHIAVQQPFKPLWSRLLLYDLEPSQASFALRFKSLLMTLLPASDEFLSKFPSSRYLSSSGSYPLDPSGLGDPAGSNATAGLALKVTGTHKPLHHDKV